VTNLVLASIFLPVSHFGLSSSPLRGFLVEKLGERHFLTLYKIVTVAAFVWLIATFRAAPVHSLWVAPVVVKLAFLPVLLPAFVLVVTAVTTPNPMIVGSKHLFAQRDVVAGYSQSFPQWLLLGRGLWALAHLVASGDLAGVMMFGSVGGLALVGAPVLDGEKAARHGADWRAFVAVTFSVPFLAIAQRRQRLARGEIGWWRFAIAIVLFIAALYGH
jgi:uncharacterized membrane protein